MRSDVLPPRCHVRLRLAALLSLLLLASGAAVAGDKRSPSSDHALEVWCVAGCPAAAPKVVFSRPTALSTGPLPVPPGHGSVEVLRGMWCGERGTCTAIGAPIRRRYHHRH